MKLRSAPLDDAHLELLLALDEAAEERWTQPLHTLANGAYRAHRRALRLLIAIVGCLVGNARLR